MLMGTEHPIGSENHERKDESTRMEGYSDCLYPNDPSVARSLCLSSSEQHLPLPISAGSHIRGTSDIRLGERKEGEDSRGLGSWHSIGSSAFCWH